MKYVHSVTFHVLFSIQWYKWPFEGKKGIILHSWYVFLKIFMSRSPVLTRCYSISHVYETVQRICEGLVFNDCFILFYLKQTNKHQANHQADVILFWELKGSQTSCFIALIFSSRFLKRVIEAPFSNLSCNLYFSYESVAKYV